MATAENEQPVDNAQEGRDVPQQRPEEGARGSRFFVDDCQADDALANATSAWKTVCEQEVGEEPDGRKKGEAFTKIRERQ